MSFARKQGAVLVALTVIYFLAGKLGLSFASINDSASAVWPPTGIALGAILLLGYRAWPAIFVGAFLVNVTTAGSVIMSLGIATGNTLEAVAGAFLVQRFANGSGCLEQARDIFKFTALGALSATTISATIGVATLMLGGRASPADAGAVWFTWWLGDACGALIVTPLVLFWLDPRYARRGDHRRRDTAAVLIGAAALGFFVFTAPVVRDYRLAFVCLPPLAWAASRFRARETAAGVALLTLIATSATEGHLGPFALPSRNESLLVLQAFMATLSLMTLPIAALVAAEREARGREESARAAAEAASRAKDEFLATLSHELRNPLQAIVTSGALLRESVEQGGTADLPLEIMARQTAHLTRLVNDLLDVTSAIAGKITLIRQPVDLQDVVTHCVAQLTESGRFMRHTIDVHAEPAWVDGDPVRLEQIVQNLIGNSIRYSPPGGAVRVSVSHEGQEAVLRVSDDGMGIPPELLPRVFDLFTQGERRLDRRDGGLGVGLTLVRTLAQLHGGRVVAASEGAGRGSEFMVRLPLNPPPNSPSANVPDSGAVAAPAAGGTIPFSPTARNGELRIVIIEDNVDARAALRTLLAVQGHEVHEADNGRDGVELSRRMDPDLVLIDIGLPGFDGYEVARLLRKKDGGPQLIAVTGYGRPEDRERAREAGFHAHLVKPVAASELGQLLGQTHRDLARLGPRGSAD